MARYIPTPSYPDKMPIDISFVFEDEKPAGKHGFTHVEGDNIVFEDGTPVKFWGVNFNGGACFPDKDYAHKVARRLAQAGCNIVRFHQLDAEWDTPNLFAYTKGKRVTTTRQLDPRSMDALDYLIYALKEEGIYCYLDMLTYRKFKEGDDVPDYDQLQDLARPWCMTNPRLIELQKEFCTQIWNHYNPYTKLAYKDDPVFVLCEIVNECDLFRDTIIHTREYVLADYYVREFRGFFRDYLAERNLEYDWENCDLYTNDEPMVQFKYYMTTKYFSEMYNHLRALGVKIPITGTNWPRPEMTAHVAAHQDMDFTDGHHYYYDWKWSNTDRICQNYSITASKSACHNLSTHRLPNKPYFISEWDMPWPNSYRAEGSIYYAALGALQNWSGFTIHTYAYSAPLDKMDVLGRELSLPVGGVPYREGIFSTWNDPAKFGLFYHAALMLRRGDISPANKKVAVRAQFEQPTSSTAFQGLLEQHQCAIALEDTLPEGFDEMVQDKDVYPHPDARYIRSDNGQMWRDMKWKVGVIDTPRTKVVYGRMGLRNHVASTKKKYMNDWELDGMTVTCTSDFGVIALSSLTNDGIEHTDNMLLSAIGRARNTDMLFDGEKMLDAGRAPIMSEVIEADIAIKTEHGDKLRVWGVNAEGFYAGRLPTTYEDGYLRFHIGDEENPAIYYLITKE